MAPYVELGSGRPVNVLLGSDNNLDQEPGSDSPNVAPLARPAASPRGSAPSRRRLGESPATLAEVPLLAQGMHP